jgi:hypothetical protein
MKEWKDLGARQIDPDRRASRQRSVPVVVEERQIPRSLIDAGCPELRTPPAIFDASARPDP